MSGQEPAPRRTFWGDTHQNCYTGKIQPIPISEVLAFTKTHLDFYGGAYYTPMMTRVSPLPELLAAAFPQAGGHHFEQTPAGGWLGFFGESIKPQERLDREWAEFQAAIAGAHEPGRFVTFPGYEWQGDGTWGDHNVLYKQEGLPIHRVETLPELYARLRGQDAIAIPHHIGYRTGIRAPRWESCDETITPYTEIFSLHGCSETDEEWLGGLRRNSHMGPGLGGSVWQSALDRGLHLGCIASTDNWQNMPGCWGQGLMGCQAESLTRDGLWEAFHSRRVYGVSGDRIELDFTCNGSPMGSRLPHAVRRQIEVAVRGQDAIDRIELLKNGRVIATHNHQGAWEPPRPGQRSRFKLRVEAGWGARAGELPDPDCDWSGRAVLSAGRFTGWSPCWTGRGQGVPELEGAEARFRLRSTQTAVTNPFQVGVVLEFEADPAALLGLTLNGLEVRDTVASFAANSRVLWDKESCMARIRELTGVDPASLERQDPLFYQLAHKAKLHRAIPEAGYTARLSVTDDGPLAGEAHYRVRVEQRNGQRAWSSPIWVAGG
jgi:hypothetical protein